MSLTNQPRNPNFLGQTNFRFSLTRAPSVMFFGTKANIPQITLPTATQASPLHPVFHAGHKIIYDDLRYTFMVDEDFTNWLEIFNWMNQLGLPDKHDPYKTLKETEGVMSDATLTVLSAKKNANKEFKYIGIWPKGLSELEFNVQDNDIKYITCTATFQIQRYYLSSVGGVDISY